MNVPRRRLLLVEDEALIALREAEQLAASGYEVSHVADGNEAVELCRSNPGGFDLVLMDLELRGSGIDGVETARRILEIADLPVIFISCHSESEAVGRTGAVPNYGFVTKASETAVLLATIRMAFRLRRAHETLVERNAALERANEKLARSERRFKSFVEDSQDIIFTLDRLGRFSYSSPNRERGGRRIQARLGAHFGSLVHPEDLEACQDYFDATLRGAEGERRLEFRIRTSGGRWSWFETSGSAVRDEAGAFSYFLGIARNIDERKGLEEQLRNLVREKEALMKELQHRVKNSLGLVSSLLSLGSQTIGDEPARRILRDTVARIDSIGAIYELLSLSGSLPSVELDGYLEAITRSIHSTFESNGERIRLSTRFEPLRIKAKQAATLGLMVTELLTNSLKYAFPRGRSGTISVELEKRGADAVLRVIDDGRGFAPGFDPESSTGLGMLLLRSLSSQAHGKLAITGDSGVTATIAFRPE